MLANVSFGSKGESVVALQVVLRAMCILGADGLPLEVDGDAGENTVFAINTFQTTMRSYGFEVGTNGENDGTFGEKCWSCLLGGDF